MPKFLRTEMNGLKFGKLTVIEQAGIHPKRKGVMWLCQCECGRQKKIEGRLLRDGTTNSCGCLKGQWKKHGKTFSPTYSSWRAMLKRCLNERHPAFRNYGGRGITVCERWRSDFRHFLADMGERPSLDQSLDRIDTNGNYEPGNCRWVEDREQSRNTRTNRLITHEGRTLCLAEWAEIAGIPAVTLGNRLDRGVPFEKAMSRQRRKRLSNVNGAYAFA